MAERVDGIWIDQRQEILPGQEAEDEEQEDATEPERAGATHVESATAESTARRLAATIFEVRALASRCPAHDVVPLGLRTLR